MWVGVKGAGVFQFANNTFVPLTGNAVSDLLKDPYCLLMDHSGRMWIGAGEDFVLCRDGDRWHRYHTLPNRVRSHVNALAEESDGTVWAGLGAAGLLQFKDGRSVAVSSGAGLAGNSVQTLLADRDGGFWGGH